MSEVLNQKLIESSDNNESRKIRKYLSYGANPFTDNNRIITNAIYYNDVKTLSIIFPPDCEKKNKEIIKADNNIIFELFRNDNPKTFKLLEKYIDIENYKQTTLYDNITTMHDALKKKFCL